MEEVARKKGEPAGLRLDRLYRAEIEAQIRRRTAQLEPSALVRCRCILRHDKIERGRDHAFGMDMRDMEIASARQPD